MSKVIEYANFSDLEEKVDDLYSVYNHVEYLGDVGLNQARFYCC